MANQKVSSPAVTKKMRSVGALIKGSFELMRQNLGKYVLVAIVPVVAIILLVILGILAFMLDNRIIFGIIVSVLYIALIAISIMASAAFYILTIKSASKPTLKDIWIETKSKSWQFILVNIATMIFVMLWMFLFVIPGIMMAVAYSFALYVYLVEDYKGTSALKRSKELVKGYWWAVFGRFLALYAIFYGVLIVLAIIFDAVDNAVLNIVYMVINQVISILMGVIGMIYSYLMYQDMAIIKGKSAIIDKSGKTTALTVFLVIMVLFGVSVTAFALSAIPKAFNLNGQSTLTGNSEQWTELNNNMVVKAYQIQEALAQYNQDYDKYPSNLSALNSEYASYLPQSMDGFKYKKTAEDYSLCFDLEEDFFLYKAGENCFTGADYSE